MTIWTPETADADPTRIPVALDPEQQRMTGHTRHGNREFDVPFISPIAENLWSGGCATGLVLPTHIEHVVSLYPWEQYQITHAVKSLTAIVMYDDPESGQSEQRLWDVARWVRACTSDGPTLVHCQAGLNRSGLVTALTLRLLGHRPEDAVAMLREKRSPACLCNEEFERLALEMAA
jgi:protein-tyrosine phosphatase